MNTRQITPRNDAVFKMIFTDPKHERIMIHFLNCAIDSNDKIKEVEILNSEHPEECLTQSGFRLDIRAKTDDNLIVNVEVKMDTGDPHVIGRSLFYCTKLFEGSFRSGSRGEKLTRTVSINILDFNLFEDDNQYYRTCSIKDDEVNEQLTDRLELQFLELNKLEKYTKDKPITFWMEFFKDPYSEACQELYTFVPEIKEAKDVFEEIKSDPEKRRMIEER